MKRKRHYQIQLPPVTSAADVQREIENFVRAVDSYAAHAAQQPDLSFQKHLVNTCASEEGRPAARTRRQ